MMDVAYVVTEGTRADSARIVLAHLEHLATRGHNVALFILAQQRGMQLDTSFPVHEYTYAEQVVMCEALRRRPGARVAVNWRAATAVAGIGDGRTLYLSTDFETKIAFGFREARAAVGAYRLGLPMLTTSRWARQQFERVFGLEVPLVSPGVDLAQFHRRDVPLVPAQVAYIPMEDAIWGLEVFTEAIQIAHSAEPSISLAVIGDGRIRCGAVPIQRPQCNDEGMFAEVASECLCFASSSHHETSGLTQLEAMACGCPVVATRADGNEAFCRDEFNSLLVPTHDPAALAGALVRLVRDPSLRARLADGAVSTAAENSWDRSIDQLEQLLTAALASARESIPEVAVSASAPAVEGRVSVVIPTRNGGSDFRALLQRLVREPDAEMEIVVIDSGSSDSTVANAEEAGAAVLRISPAEYNHGATRNRAAAVATGDYILFLTQDVFPVGDGWLRSLIRPLTDDALIAASTCREVPRSDADLFACWGIWNHHNGLHWHQDKVTSAADVQDSRGLRAAAQLTTNCMAVKRDAFERYRFKEVPLGEDLELGIRMLRDGHKLAFLYSTGVVHSHTRDPAYVLKRYYADSKVVPTVLGVATSLDVSVDEALWAARTLYAHVRSSVATSGQHDTRELLGAIVERGVPHTDGGLGDDSLGELLGRVCPEVHNLSGQNLLLPGFRHMVGAFRTYLDSAAIVLDDRRGEIEVALYKICAASIGGLLGTLAAGNADPAVEARLRSVDAVLSGGV